jgi:outer membrane receptor for ferrienterochelin and colicins
MIRSLDSRCTILVLALTCVATATGAAEPEVAPVAPPPAVQKVEKIEVKTSQDNYDARREDTATKIVVTQEEINKFGDSQLADVLKRQPGITVTNGDIRMRGLGNGYTQILLNGERAPPGFSLDTLSPGMVERIEILRAATAEFSTQSIAGTINIVLKKKVSVAQRELKLAYFTGRGYKAPNAHFILSDKEDNFSWSVNGSYFGGFNDYDTGGGESGNDANGVQIFERQYVNHITGNFHAVSIAPRLNWTLSGGDTLTWQSFANYNRGRNNGDRRIITIQGADVTYPTSLTRNESDNTLARTDLNWVHKLAEGAKLDLKVGLNSGVRDLAFYQRTFSIADVQNLDSTVISSAKDTGTTFTGKYSTPIVEGHALVAGWDTALAKRTENRDQRDKPLPGVIPVISFEDFDASVLKLAAFAQDEWNVTQDWSVYLGLRWEGLTTTSVGNAYAEIENRSSVWSPLVQTLYKLPGRKAEQIRLALTRTYKAPATASLIPRRFTSTNNTPTDPDSQGNPNLRPELATGIDVALEKFWDKGAMMSLSGALRRITDFNRRGLSFVNGRWLSQPINDGSANTRSLEYDAKFPVQIFYPAAPPIDFRFNMNRNWSTVNSVPGPNNRLDQQTPFSATVGLDYRMKSGEFTAGGSYSFKNGGQVRISETQGRYQTPRRELDVYALWKFTPKTQFRLGLSNVLRQDYINESSYADQFGSQRQRVIFPSAMHVRTTLEMKF